MSILFIGYLFSHRYIGCSIHLKLRWYYGTYMQYRNPAWQSSCSATTLPRKSQQKILPFLSRGSTFIRHRGSSTNYFYASDEVCQAFKNVETIPYTVLITNNENFANLYDTLNTNDMYVYSNTYQSLETIGSIVKIFDEFFSLILMFHIDLFLLLWLRTSESFHIILTIDYNLS